MELDNILLPALVSAIGTPLIISILSRLFRQKVKITTYTDYETIRRKKTAYKIVGILFLFGLVAPIGFYDLLAISEDSAWPVALGWSFSVMAPVIFLRLRYVRKGFGVDEFFRYGEIEDGIPRGTQVFLFGVWVLASFVVSCFALYQWLI
ncbi:hypothetical protein [Salicola sp. Rm-C-2C1-2]|uniref:hypothetical protein n=1 Tax=Salicola sp. Rm-C-2C1-2 TaxID=3141321 RepID=UPI0032E502E3